MVVKPYEAGVPSASRLPGQMITKNTCKWQIRQPNYNKGRTIFRPWPTLLPNGAEVPWRDSEGRFGTSFFVQDLVCMGWGLDFRFTCFAEVSDQSEWPQGSPCQLFCDDMRASGNKDFKDLFERIKGSFAPLGNPRTYGFIKGMLIANAGKDFKKNPIWGCVLMMPPSMRESFEMLINSPANPNAAVQYTSDDDPFGHASRYFVGNPVSLKHGKVFEFHKSSAFEDADSDVGVNTSGVAAAPSGREKSDIESYACRLWPKTPVLPLPVDKVKRWDMPFEEAFWYMTGEEQITLCLIPGFGRSRKDALLYTFGGKNLLPASFEFGRTTVDMGASKQEPDTREPQSSNDDDEEDDDAINLGGDDFDDQESGYAAEPETPAVTAPVVHTAAASDITSKLRERMRNATRK